MRAATVCAALGALIAIDGAYGAHFARADFSLPGFVTQEQTGLIRLVPWVIALVPLAWMPLAVVRPSELLLWGLYLMVVLPTAVVANYSLLSWQRSVLMMLIMCAGMLWLRLFQHLPLVRLPRLRQSRVAFWGALLVTSVVFYALVINEFGATMRFVTLEEVYQQRAIWAGTSAGLLVSYAQSWQAGVINVFLLAYGLHYRKWLPAIVGLLGELFMFTVGAQRILLFLPVMMLGVLVLTRQRGLRFGPIAAGGVAALYGVAWMLPVEDSAFATLFAQFTLNRLFTNNGLLASLYFDYFASHPHAMFSEMKPLSFFVKSPYSIGYKEELGWYYWGYYNDPNANLMADGFAQLGYLGVLMECAVLGAAFWVLDSVARSSRLPRQFVLLCLTMQMATVANGQIPNMLLGGGFALTVLLLYATPAGSSHRFFPTR